MLSQADLALYAAKGAGKGRWRRYEPGLHLAAVDRLEVRTELERAIASGAFALLLPADRRSPQWRDRRRGGARALAPSPARHRGSGRLHPRRRGDRAGRAAGRVGPRLRAGRPRPLAARERAGDVRDDERQRVGPPGARSGVPGRAGRGTRPVGRAGGVAGAGDHGDGAARRRRAGLRRPGRAARARPAHRHRRLRHRLLVAGLPPAARHRRSEDRPVLHQRDRDAQADRPRSSERSCTSPRRSTSASSPRASRPPRSATPCSRPAVGWVRDTSSRFRCRPTRSSPGCSPLRPRPVPAHADVARRWRPAWCRPRLPRAPSALPARTTSDHCGKGDR